MTLTVKQFHRVLQTGAVFDSDGTKIQRTHHGAPLPKISIVTPSFNQGEYLEECIDSVLSQNYPNLEYVIMDGGSTDGSVEIIRKYEKYLSYWQSQPDEGQYPAINAGFQRTSGEVMAWINSDDRLYPDALKTVGQALAEIPQVRWLTGRPSVIDGNGKILDIQRLPSLTYTDYIDPERDIFLQQESTFWRRSLWSEHGGALNESLSLAADFELWLRYFRTDKLYCIDKMLGAFRAHAGQKSDVGFASYLDEMRSTIKAEQTRQPAAPRNASPGSPIELVTSLVPRIDRLQRLAVKTWLRLGFSVTSMNIPDEQETLRPLFPEVNFVTPRKDGRSKVGKPMVFFDDILDYCRRSSAKTFGIINSDIFLEGDASLIDFLVQEAKGGLVYGSRYEVDTPVSARGWLYTSGFDYFFFDRTLLKAYPSSDFMLGVPWWDYWAPLIPALKGIPIKNLRAPIAFHVSHAANYDWNQLRDFGADFAQRVGKHRITRMHQRHNEVLSNGAGQPHETYSITVLADMARQQISKSARRIEWHGPKANLNRNALIDASTTTPRVTAIVSTYCSEAFIGECLNDLTSQSIASDIEIIVIDAASPQNEAAIVADFQQRHGNIRYARTPERIGVYAAWNMAIRMAQGRYLVSCSTNDRLRHDALELMADALDERPEMGLVYGNSYLTRTPHRDFETFEEISDIYAWPDFSYQELLRKPGIGPHPMWRRSLHDEFGNFDESFKAIADQDFWLRIARTRDCLHLHDFTGLYLLDPDSLSGNLTTASSEIRIVHERHARTYQFADWQKSHTLTKAQAAHYDKRRGASGKPPEIAIAVLHNGTNEEGIAQTLRNLAGQYDQNFFVVVVSSAPMPEGFSGERLIWCQAETPSTAFVWTLFSSGGLPRHAEWIVTLSAGEQLAPHALLVFLERVQNGPHEHAFYADEDFIDPAGNRSAPAFKPTPDLTLLRQTDYIQHLFAVSMTGLQKLSIEGFHNSEAAEYDLALRLLEEPGTPRLGHIPDILIHRPLDHIRPAMARAHREALLDHLNRTGTAAEIAQNSAQGPISINYSLPGTPLVTVVLSCTDDPARLERYLAGFLQHTRYPAWEILIIPPPHPEKSRNFLSGISGLQEQKIRVLTLDSPSSTTRASLALTEANGELLLFASADTVPAHPGWLESMLQHMARPNIGIAGARLILPNGQIESAAPVFGFLGAQGSPYRGFPMTYPGNQSLLHAQQERTVIDPRCLLIRATALSALGGLDPHFQSLAPALTDLCLRAHARRIKAIWTPGATLLVDGSALTQETEDIEKTSGTQPMDDDHHRLLKQWLPVYPCDPAHNPNISRSRRGYQIEPDAALNWNPTPWRPAPRCVAYAADFAGCGYYRVIDPLEALVKAGRLTGFAGSRGYTVPEIAQLDADCFIFQRQYKDTQLQLLKFHKDYSQALRIYELDDLITYLPEKSAFRTGIPDDISSRLQEAIGLCDRLVVSTQPLADAYGKFAGETRVVPNYLPGEKWSAHAPARRKSARPRVGWAGALGHTGDLELIVPVVEALAGEVDWVFMGDIHPAIRLHVKERHPYVPIEHYPAALAALGLDLALAPLEINSFNEAKSHIKLLEYGILGYPVICTDITPYQGDFPVTRLRNQPKQWIDAIREHIHDPVASAAAGARLQEHVTKHWLLENNLEVWMRAWTR